VNPQALRLSYTVSFESPFHLGSGLRRGLAHRSVCRDPEGRLYIPGSTLKGIVRQHCESIASVFGLPAPEPHRAGADVDAIGCQPGIVDQVFGSRFHPGTVSFDDAHLLEEDLGLFLVPGCPRDQRFLESQVEPRSRVALDRRTRTASQGHLFTSEYGLPGLRFRGRIGGVLGGVPLVSTVGGLRVSYPLILLVAGLLAVERLGADRSVGAGVVSIWVDELLWSGAPLEVADLLDQLADLEYYEMAAEEELA